MMHGPINIRYIHLRFLTTPSVEKTANLHEIRHYLDNKSFDDYERIVYGRTVSGGSADGIL